MNIRYPAIFFLSFFFCTIAFPIEKEKFFYGKLQHEVEVAKGELLVKFKPSVAETQRAGILAAGKASRKSALKQFGVDVIKLPPGKSVQDALDEYKNLPDIEYTEPNFIVRAFITPNDARFSEQWGLTRTGVDYAWEKTTGAGTLTVAVLDTGIDFTHPDLQVNVDSTSGYNFVISTASPADDNGHGTHVAGIIAATTNNSLGVSGVAGGWWSAATRGVRIMSVKILDEYGESSVSSLVNGIRYAADNGAQVINMSLGSPDLSMTEYNAVQYANDKGCILVAASGNGEKVTDPYGNVIGLITDYVMYPAAFDNVIAVGAMTNNNARASFSSYGSQLDFVAPGVNILSTVPDHFPGIIISTEVDHVWDPTGYTRLQGTSMAAPFVSGVVALLLSKNPALAPGDVIDTLKITATDLGPRGKDMETGFGMVNAAEAIKISTVQVDKPKNAPNPFNPGTGQKTRIYVPVSLKGSFLKIRIYNIAGERVRNIESYVTGLYDWDGRNDDGQVVADGIYIYAVETNKGKATGKMTVSSANENY